LYLMLLVTEFIEPPNQDNYTRINKYIGYHRHILVVQSLFGMGILIFGTRTLLLLGYEFILILGYLILASLAILLLQALATRVQPVQISKYLYLLSLLGIGAGLWLTEAVSSLFCKSIIIGMTLLLSAFVRILPASRNFLVILLKRHQPIYNLVMGVILTKR
jgi:hypothetical protein